MNSSKIATLTLAVLGSTLAAQTNTMYSPAHLATVEGLGSSYYFGAYADARVQLVDGEHRGTIGVIREIAMRLDDRSYTSYDGMGRRWSNVSIWMADGDVDNFSDKLDSNPLSTPTAVFSGSVTWPTMNGKPMLKPDLWGGITGASRFPFTTNWLTLGKDILSDWTFNGGALENSAAWSTGTRMSYYLDSDTSPGTNASATSVALPATRLDNGSPGVTGRCNDAKFGSTSTGAYIYGYATVYSPYYANVDWRNQLVLYSTSTYTAPGAPVIHAWAFQGSTTGVDIGTGCNRLHVQGPMIEQAFAVPPLSVSTSGSSSYQYVITPWVPAMANFKITMQAAWADSQTGLLNLSQARELTLPDSAPNAHLPVRSAVHSAAGSATTYGPSDAYYYNPALRYVY